MLVDKIGKPVLHSLARNGGGSSGNEQAVGVDLDARVGAKRFFARLSHACDNRRQVDLPLDDCPLPDCRLQDIIDSGIAPENGNTEFPVDAEFPAW